MFMKWQSCLREGFVKKKDLFILLRLCYILCGRVKKEKRKVTENSELKPFRWVDILMTLS